MYREIPLENVADNYQKYFICMGRNGRGQPGCLSGEGKIYDVTDSPGTFIRHIGMGSVCSEMANKSFLINTRVTM
jgi:hypothetical protein